MEEKKNYYMEFLRAQDKLIEYVFQATLDIKLKGINTLDVAKEIMRLYKETIENLRKDYEN